MICATLASCTLTSPKVCAPSSVLLMLVASPRIVDSASRASLVFDRPTTYQTGRTMLSPPRSNVMSNVISVG